MFCPARLTKWVGSTLTFMASLGVEPEPGLVFLMSARLECLNAPVPAMNTPIKYLKYYIIYICFKNNIFL